MAKGIKLPDYLRLIGGPITFLGGDHDANLGYANFGADIDIRLRPFNFSRKAKNAFTIEAGPSFDMVSDQRRSSRVMLDLGVVYKANQYFGVGIYGGAGVKVAKAAGGTEKLSAGSVRGEIHIYRDTIRVGGGLVFVGEDAAHPAGVVQILFDVGNIVPFFAFGGI